jgi:hypothetical protein
VSELPSTSGDDDLVIEICNLGVLVHILHKPRQCLITGRSIDYADILLRSVLEKLALRGRKIPKESLSEVGSTGKFFRRIMKGLQSQALSTMTPGAIEGIRTCELGKNRHIP